MAIPIPESAGEVEQRAKIDVQRELNTSNPFLQNSWIGSVITAFSFRIFDAYLTNRDLGKEALPDTAVAFLDRWAAIWGFTRLAATSSTGNILVTGTVSTNIPLSTVFVASDGRLYTSTSSADTTSVPFSIAVGKLTQVAGVATCETPSDHGMASNCLITITGADQTDYNVTDAVITVTAADKFTFPVLNLPVSPATGTITATSVHAVVPVSSNDTGAGENQDFDAQLNFQTPPAGLNSEANVDFGELGGGTDLEDVEFFRERYLESLRNPVAHFNEADIRRTSKTVNGVTRVFVLSNTPVVGAAEIYFMRDGEGDGIPSGSEVVAVDDVIQAIRPATTIEADVVTAAPVPNSEAYTFSAMSPNTPGMQTAVNAALDQFYAEKTTLGGDITDEDYKGAISNAVDFETGEEIISYSLSSPTTDLTIAATEIGTKGTVTFP